MLKESVNRYIRLRRSAGYKLDDVSSLLQSFAKYAVECGDTHVVTKTAISWAEKSSSQCRRNRKMKTVIQFARFIRIEDDRHEIPPDGIFYGHATRRCPYIFSDSEIRLILEQASRLGPNGSIRPHTYSTLFALLSVTGLRISEALSLRIGDITRDGLVILETKFQKNRLVPLHDTTLYALRRYLGKRRRIAGADDHFFVSNGGKKLTYSSAYETFHKVCVSAGIPSQSSAVKIRLHDLRHTFAVRALEAGPDCRERVTSHTLALTTYMGHATLASTYWYLESTPQLMSDISKKCESFFCGGTR